MNSSSIDASREQLLETYQGRGAVENCSLPFISDRKERIKQRFSELGYFQQLPPVDKSIVYLRCMKLNHNEILKTLGACTLLGGVVGGAVGGIAANGPGVLGGAGAGAAVGGTVGALICYHRGLHMEKEHIIAVIKDTTEYSLFKKQRTKEQYELFVAFFKSYGQHMNPKHENRILDFVCRITWDIPEYPVFSPYDLKRAQPFEKAAIEAHIDGIEKKIADYQSDREKMISEYREVHTFASGLPAAKIEEGIQKISTICLFGGEPYTKEELVYDPEFAKTVILSLQEIQEEMLQTHNPEQDPIILKGVSALIDHYRSHYSSVTADLINKLGDDVFSIKGNYKMARETTKAIRKALDLP